jgi:hypothetical protein
MYKELRLKDSNWSFISIALDETLIQLEEGACLSIAKEISKNTG